MGNAGNVYVNKQNGNLVIRRDDITTGDGNHPYTISSIYNSITNYGQGGWRYNHDSYVGFMGLYFIDENGTYQYLEYEEGLNDQQTMTLKENECGFETMNAVALSSQQMTVFEGTRYEKTISVPSSIMYQFTTDNGSFIYSFTSEYNLTKIEVRDENDAIRTVMAKIKDSQNPNAYYICDDDGNQIHVVKNGDVTTMTQLTADNETVNTETVTKDSAGNVISVERNGQLISSFTYDSYKRITSVTNDKGYKLSFGYSAVTDNKVSYRVISVQEYMNTAAGKKTTFTRTYDSCTERSSGINGVFNDADDVITKYSFDSKCRLICTQSETAEGEKLDNKSYTYKDDKLSGTATSGRISDNYLKNHNIESLNNWTSGYFDDRYSVYNTSYDTERYYVGNGSAKVTVSDMTRTGAAGVYQSFDISDSSFLERGREYVASVYINTDGITRDTDTDASRNYGAALAIKMEYNDGTSTTRNYTEAVKDTDGSWERVFT